MLGYEEICDCHVHFGKFGDQFFSAADIATMFDTLGVGKVGIMPFGLAYGPEPSVEEAYASLPSDRFVNYLWLSPEMLEKSPNLSEFQNVNYKLIKIHGYARQEWYYLPEKIRQIFNIASIISIPIMFHTGGYPGSDAIQYLMFCQEFPEVKVILAHAKPLDQAIAVMRNAPNAFVDSSFVHIEGLQAICDAGFGDRIIFGSDFPAMKCFRPEIELVDWYRDNINCIVNTFGERQFMVWAHENFHKVILKD